MILRGKKQKPCSGKIISHIVSVVNNKDAPMGLLEGEPRESNGRPSQHKARIKGSFWGDKPSDLSSPFIPP